jgi:inorganic triphosphatase YgiF
LQLLEDIPLRITNINKAQRGYMLVRETGHAPYRAQALQLDADATCATPCPQCWATAWSTSSATKSPWWKATIRKRCTRCASACAACVPRSSCSRRWRPARPLLEDIDWLGMELGAARDWDVLLSSTLARMDAAQIELQRWRCKPRTPNGARRRKPCCRRATRG